MIGLLLVVAAVCILLAFACWWADSRPPLDTEPYAQPSHVRLIDDQEPGATR